MLESKIVKALELINSDTLYILSDRRKSVEPPSPYCLITVISTALTRTSDESLRSEVDTLGKGRLRASQEKQVQVRLTFHGDSDSVIDDLAEEMKDACDCSFGHEAFGDQGFSVLNVGNILRVPIVRDTDTFIRYVLTISLLTETTREFKTDVIKEVRVEPDWQGSAVGDSVEIIIN